MDQDDRTIDLPARGSKIVPIGGAGPKPPASPAEAGADPISAGKMIGHYLLRRPIGEGGMGLVWEADQQEPIRRRVALKMVKRGMDTAEFIARFSSERQALAMMNHPAIAKVLDAGATDEGRPYFVMEYVEGVPLNVYCDQERLSLRRRLELFIHVCEGVQHAHQKAIIHRDLKPSNVLVTETDGQPVPKIIDFGVAKALDREDFDDTLSTGAGQLIGTPEYMSPEQTGLSGEGIDTRTDVYALGVLLYELLVGQRPFRREDLAGLNFLEVLQIIREVEPPRPSVAGDDHRTSCARAADRAGAQPGQRARPADARPARRSRLDHDEGAREGPRAPLRLGQRAGRRRAAPSGRRAGEGRPAVASATACGSSCGGTAPASRPAPSRWRPSCWASGARPRA